MTEVDQLITHLVGTSVASEFIMAANLVYNYDGATISGIRFSRYKYDFSTAALTSAKFVPVASGVTKILIHLDSFPAFFGNQSPKTTAFRFSKTKNEACGSIQRYDPASEDTWLYTWNMSSQTTIDYTTAGTLKKILDCNPFSA